MRGEPTFLGVDVGTSVVKAVVFDGGGRALAVRGRELPLSHGPGGAVEQDLGDLMRSLAEVVRAVVAESGRTPSLLALTGQGDGCWLTDADHHPVRPGMSWLDGRAAGILHSWEEDGVPEAVYRANGTRMFPGTAAPLLAWLAEHEPETLDRAATAGYCKDAVFGRLTGVRATDPSDSSMPFGDGSGRGYSDTVLSLTGLDDHRHLLPPVHTLPEGPLSAEGAALLGLPEGLPVSSGPFDFPACAVGAGVEADGDALMIIGTTLGCLVRTDRLDTGGEPAGFHIATGDRWLRAMPAMVGTASVDWLLSTLRMDVDELGASLAESDPGAGGVEVLPYLATSGERAPFVDPRARGQISGVRLTTSRHDLVRGVCEGLAYAARHCFETAGLSGRLLVCGGGSRSLPWLQVFADVLGTPLATARAPEVGARGAVLTAAGDRVDRRAWTAPSAVVEPEPARASRYEDGYARYLDHLSAARALWPDEHETRRSTPA
ncbi:carbohydrate kinase [Nocardiopsis sp. HNM0947]|uniref:Carbohydrate kinase n=1 Tax=Nocardiopsis coralli TaxID=2772213 RepID=A0ABR9P7Y8_9ACTN|nr:FGGY-family carbohydrate kinase [Nocardiopsis coralli]MBE2999962.1 carbohydrate kinase [Nocardiopsis coralli]